ncbi:WG repeat-containing protein [Mucilaginibacter flavidus]|uniref:WG repeat-containing protein n=1 Tax=Mucilaginibacter flavidus TaxID=2949309 RepID=UPI002093869E|nr:WG repeat-containing protein [Mucilaginibacter flavidus]MCO5946657.1 WG repeat-containing protein [Mucilaginibacter flavidus]
MINKYLLIPVFLFFVHTACAQIFAPNKYGYVTDPKFRQLIKTRGYELVGSFDTLQVSPLIVIAPFQKNGKWGSIDNHGKVFVKPADADLNARFIKGDVMRDDDEVRLTPNKTGNRPVAPRVSFTKYSKTGKYGTRDVSGREGVPAVYDMVNPFNDSISYVRSGKLYGVFYSDGRPIIPVDYDQVSFSYNKQQLFTVKKDKFYGVIALDGKLVIPIKYDKILFDFTFKDLVKVTLNNKTALFNAVGKQLTDFTFDNLGQFGKGGIAMVSVGIGQDKKMGAIDTLGKQLLPAEFQEASYYSPKLFLVSTGKYPARLSGLVDVHGKPVSAQDYTQIEAPGKDGLAKVSRGSYPDRKSGFIDSTGNEVIKVKYTSLENFSLAGFAIVKTDDKMGLINRKDVMVVPPVYDVIMYNFAKKDYYIKLGGKQGLMDATGKVLLPPTYDVLRSMRDYGYIAGLDQKQGVLNDELKVIVPLKYDKIETSTYNKAVQHGIVYATLSGKKCAVDLYGNEYFEPAPVEKIYDFKPDANGYVTGPAFQQFIKERGFQLVSAFDTLQKKPLVLAVKVMLNGAWKIMDTKGVYYGDAEPTTSMYHNDVKVTEEMSSGVTIDMPLDENSSVFGPVVINGKYGTANNKTNAVGLPAIYDNLTFMGHGWVITRLAGKYGVAMDNGKEIITPKYESITPDNRNGKFDFTQFFVRDGGKYGLISADGKQAIPLNYDQLQNLYGVDKSNILLKFSVDEKWGLITRSGKVLLPASYDELNYFNRGLLKTVVKSGYTKLYGLVDSTGKVLLAPQYGAIELDYNNNKVLNLTTAPDKPEKHGEMSIDGKMLLKPIYDQIVDLKNGLIRVKLNGKYGLITKSEKFVVQPLYDQLYIGRSDHIAIIEQGRKKGVIDLSGNKIIAPVYDELYPNKENYVFERDGKWGIMNSKEKVLTALAYQSITPGYNCFIVELNGKSGLMDTDGKLITAIKYDRFPSGSSTMKQGLAEVRLDSRRGTIDYYGNEYFER